MMDCITYEHMPYFLEVIGDIWTAFSNGYIVHAQMGDVIWAWTQEKDAYCIVSEITW